MLELGGRTASSSDNDRLVGVRVSKMQYIWQNIFKVVTGMDKS